ncbi:MULTISPECIES: RluA family pseudouridine synthase [Marinicauda]|jgi:23S rRNA pseudouridine1911/1915/1917 synthase|uniref:RluA family pseudouridine synthase n=1 Tax=Marinicauda TaxID=1649466 RepID=UPI0022E00597|nr:RluA family pseudouridine synthase [Marinicauda sp. Alg238-R41]
MSDAVESHEIIAEDADQGTRLDRFLAERLEALSRTRCKALIEDSRLRADGAVLTDPSAKVQAGSTYVLEIPAPEQAEPVAEDIPLDILFEDEHLVIVNKAAGMTVHPAAGNWTGTLVHALLHHCRGSLSGIGGVERPGIVHRLDKDTSGVMVAAKTDAAHQGLQKLFAKHDIERVYLAFVRGSAQPRAGRIETRLVRSSSDRKKFAVARDNDSDAGKHAITNYATLKTFGQEPRAAIGTPMASLIECRLETGRTHQIRVHLAHIACPLLGDPLYGRGGRSSALSRTDDDRLLKDFRRQALHAAVLGFVHPVTGEAVRVETPLPEDMKKLQAFLESL